MGTTFVVFLVVSFASVVGISRRRLQVASWRWILLFLLPMCVYVVWVSGLYAGFVWITQFDNRRLVEAYWQKCPPRMAVSIDLGRLGNKFFEYMAARLTAEVLGLPIFITPKFGDVYDRYFSGRQSPVVDWDHLERNCSIRQSDFVNLQIDLLPDLKPKPNTTFKYVKFHGYPVDVSTTIYQSIYSRRNEFITEFQWHPHLKQNATDQLAQMKATHNRTVVVGIHARRTDYYTYLRDYFGNYTSADSSYFSKAMNHFRNRTANPLFLVFSDDMDWCHQNIKGPDVVYAGNGNQTDPGLDLALMSLCDHLVLSYGTFGMLAAWLNGHGQIVAAHNFTGKPEKMVEAMKAAQLPNWFWMSMK